MIWLKQLLFTVVYLVVAALLIFYTNIPAEIILLVAIVISGFTSRHSILSFIKTLAYEK